MPAGWWTKECREIVGQTPQHSNVRIRFSIRSLILNLSYFGRALGERGGRTRKIVHVFRFVFLTVAKQSRTSVKAQKFIF